MRQTLGNSESTKLQKGHLEHRGAQVGGWKG